jgi:hypothetical protein
LPISLLTSEADHVTDAFTVHVAVMELRLPAPYNGDTIALTELVIAQNAKQASDGADIGDLTMAQKVALKEVNDRIKMARDTAKRAFKGQTVKLHEEFQVGQNSTDLEEVMDRAEIISASLKRAENIAPLAAKGWMTADTTGFDAALAALDLNEDTQEGAKTVKLGTTATRDENANALYERVLITQNAARLQFPDTVATRRGCWGGRMRSRASWCAGIGAGGRSGIRRRTLRRRAWLLETGCMRGWRTCRTGACAGTRIRRH